MIVRLKTARLFSLILIGVSAFSLQALAGFEWVPIQKEQLPPVQMKEPEDPKGQTAPVIAVEPLMPEDLLREEPQTPPPLMPEPQTSAKTEAEPQSDSLAPLSIAPPPEILPPPMMVEKAGPAEQLPESQLKVIMAEDAPPAAIESAPESAMLKINPFPVVASSEAGPANTEDILSFEPVAEIDAAADSDTLMGFGADMPLAIALQQIVPADYAVSFSPGVNPGAIVSWNGGKTWHAVINDMLAPIGLRAVISGHVVNVRSGA